MAAACVEPRLELPPLVTAPLHLHGEIHLSKERDSVQLGPKVDRDCKRCMLDIGATNHMTGSCSVFAELDADICETVRFGDGSMVRIEGCDSVLYIGRTGEYRVLIGVYFIPRLTANIISIGQLDEVGYDIHTGGGVMRIRDE